MASPHLYELHSADWRGIDRSFVQRLARPGSTVDLVIPYYLIGHDEGTVLFDTGVSTEMYDDPESYGEFGAEEMRPVVDDLEDVRSPEAELARIGYEPADVDYVLLSHLHWDHAGNISAFDNAEVVVRQAELQYAWWPTDSIQQGAYLDGDLSALKAPEADVRPVGGRVDLFGDGTVVLFPTPGHSPGHQSLKLELDETGTVILAADVAHLRSVFDREGVSPINQDVERSIASCRTVKEMATTHDAAVLLTHEPDDGTTIPDDGLA